MCWLAASLLMDIKKAGCRLVVVLVGISAAVRQRDDDLQRQPACLRVGGGDDDIGGPAIIQQPLQMCIRDSGCSSLKKKTEQQPRP